jgi:hypothetical protein
MKRQLAAFTIAFMFGTTTAGLLVLSTPVLTGDTAWARAGGGSSGGSRLPDRRCPSALDGAPA